MTKRKLTPQKLAVKMLDHFDKIRDGLVGCHRYGIGFSFGRFSLQLTGLINHPESLKWVENEAKKITDLCRVIVLPHEELEPTININIVEIGVEK